MRCLMSKKRQYIFEQDEVNKLTQKEEFPPNRGQDRLLA